MRTRDCWFQTSSPTTAPKPSSPLGTVFLCQPALRLRIERIPSTGKLLDLDRHIEIVAENLLQCLRRARALRQQARIVDQRIVGHGLAVSQTLRSQSQQAEQMAGKNVALALLTGDVEAVFSPGAVKERDDAMIENVEKVAQRLVIGPQPFDDQRRVGDGEAPPGDRSAP